MNLFKRLLLGILGGLSATGPMTTLMLALHRRLPAASRYPLPPREIAADVVGKHELSSNAGMAFTLASHFGYGAAMGGLYAAATPAPDRNWAAKGLIAGLVVWLVSYGLLLPLARVLRPAMEHPVERSGVMILAHLLWGCFLAAFVSSTWRDRGLSGLVLPSPMEHHDRQ
jgi:putative membrane protein